MHEHDKKVLDHLKKIQAATARISASKEAFQAVSNNHDLLVALASREVETAWWEIAALMKETGEPEIMLPSGIDGYVYKIAPRQGTETVDVPDVKALPEEFIKTDYAPKKKELLAALKKKRDAGEDMPNYATIKRGEAKLTVDLVKEKLPIRDHNPDDR